MIARHAAVALCAHCVHLLARSLTFGLSQLAVMVGVHHIEVLDVRGEEFVLADCAVLVVSYEGLMIQIPYD